MKKLITANILAFIAILFTSCGCCKKATAGSNVAFYKVPLVCGAAPQIGCGSKSKPVLIGLEQKSDAISEAWLNRAGTVIAVVWKESSSSELRASTTDAVFKENKIDVTLISGKEAKAILKDFENKQNWYRGSDVDKLSMEEAGVISDRLISRVNAKTQLSKEKSDNLKVDFVQVFKSRFTKNYGSGINSNEQKVSEEKKKQTEEELLAVGKKYLNEEEIVALKDAIVLGLRPTENESKDVKGCCSPKNSSDKNCKNKKTGTKGCCAKPNQ